MSDDVVISAERVGKKYVIGHQSEREPYGSLRDVISRTVRKFLRTSSDLVNGRSIVAGDITEEFWALKEITFEVRRGEVLGIIGRNGAGKSTLLKILSRITEPTEGNVHIRGRVASLLEVGTGFHPELTGKENIFLNGAILGMTQREILKKYDEIVAFAGVEKFLDTPVKRYSSGMHVRLAFAVAAHLEPEILIVDEVLAVGDSDFQSKCLGKMGEIARAQERTVIFVSHNLGAVEKLCTRAIHFEAGQIHSMGSPHTIISGYLKKQVSSSGVIDLTNRKRGERRTAHVVTLRAHGASWVIPFGKNLSFDLQIAASSGIEAVSIGLGISSKGFEVATWSSEFANLSVQLRAGLNCVKIEFHHLTFLPGHYSLAIALWCDRGVEDWVEDALTFEVAATPETVRLNEIKGAIVASASVTTVAAFDQFAELELSSSNPISVSINDEKQLGLEV